MDAVHTGTRPEGETHLSFETAAEHATARVPMAGRFQRVGDVRELLIGQRYESASHIVVCEADRFLGIVTIEELLLAHADAKVESLMDRGAPVVAPGVDQEVAAWRAVRHGESALAVVNRDGRFVGMIPPHRLLGVLLSADHFVSFQVFSRKLGTSDARTHETTALVSGGVRLSKRLPLTLTAILPYSWISERGQARSVSE
jgi:magnesium transporter